MCSLILFFSLSPGGPTRRRKFTGLAELRGRWPIETSPLGLRQVAITIEHAAQQRRRCGDGSGSATTAATAATAEAAVSAAVSAAAVVALAWQRIGGGDAALAVAAQRRQRCGDCRGSALTGQRGGGSGGVSAAAAVALARQRSDGGNGSGSATATAARRP
jgi:hypothetical protein